MHFQAVRLPECELPPKDYTSKRPTLGMDKTTGSRIHLPVTEPPGGTQRSVRKRGSGKYETTPGWGGQTNFLGPGFHYLSIKETRLPVDILMETVVSVEIQQEGTWARTSATYSTPPRVRRGPR